MRCLLLGLISFFLSLPAVQASSCQELFITQDIPRKVTSADIAQYISQTHGISKQRIKKVIALLSTLQKTYPRSSVLEDFWVELGLQKTISEHFFETNLFKDNPTLSSRKHSDPDFENIMDRIEAVSKLTAKEIRAAKFKLEDLFLSRTRQVDGVNVWERIKIVKWLNGPYGKVETPDELKQVLSTFKNIKYKPDRIAGWRMCTSYNPDAAVKLAKRNIYVTAMAVYVRGRVDLIDHLYLAYFPPTGAEPILIDYTVNQFLIKRMSGPFVGHFDDIGKIDKELRDPKIHYYYMGTPLKAGANGISPELIQQIRSEL